MPIEVGIAAILAVMLVVLLGTSATARAVALDSIRRPRIAIHVLGDEGDRVAIVDDTDDTAGGRPSSGATVS